MMTTESRATPSNGISTTAAKWPSAGNGPKLSIHSATSSAPASVIALRKYTGGIPIAEKIRELPKRSQIVRAATISTWRWMVHSRGPNVENCPSGQWCA